VDLSASLRSNAFGAMASVRSSDLAARLAAPGGLVLAAGDLTVQVGSGGAVSVTGTFRTIEALASAVNAAMGGKGTASVAQGAAAAASQATQQSGGVWNRSSGEYKNTNAFAALKADGSVVTWGDSTYGGNSSAVAAQLSSGVQSLASPLNEELYVPEGTRVVLSSSESITFGGTQRSILGFAASTAPTGDVTDMRTTTAADATETLQRADAALQAIGSQRARLGATLSRFDSLIGDLATAGSNLTAARSRITDADYAAETAALTRTQIIQQAGQAMLAQSNTSARLILALLRSDR
jgi:flagellin